MSPTTTKKEFKYIKWYLHLCWVKTQRPSLSNDASSSVSKSDKSPMFPISVSLLADTNPDNPSSALSGVCESFTKVATPATAQKYLSEIKNSRLFQAFKAWFKCDTKQWVTMIGQVTDFHGYQIPNCFIFTWIPTSFPRKAEIAVKSIHKSCWFIQLISCKNRLLHLHSARMQNFPKF